jgi:hypothetical protein
MSHGGGALIIDPFLYDSNMIINVLDVFYMVGRPLSVSALGDLGIFHARYTLL